VPPETVCHIGAVIVGVGEENMVVMLATSMCSEIVVAVIHAIIVTINVSAAIVGSVSIIVMIMIMIIILIVIDIKILRIIIL
jgi:hypothetical protein